MNMIWKSAMSVSLGVIALLGAACTKDAQEPGAASTSGLSGGASKYDYANYAHGPIVKYRTNWGAKCLDDSNGDTASGTKIQIWDCNGTGAQSWWYMATGELIGPGGKCLDVTGGNAASGTPVQLWDCNGTDAQKWRWTAEGELVGLGGKCLDVRNNEQDNGTQVQIWDCNGTGAQDWSASGCIPPDEGASCAGPCRKGFSYCFYGKLACHETGEFTPGGTSCGEDAVCSGGGECVECKAGSTCPVQTAEDSECHQGRLDCSKGPACIDVGNVPDGTFCRGGSCHAGRCDVNLSHGNLGAPCSTSEGCSSDLCVRGYCACVPPGGACWGGTNQCCRGTCGGEPGKQSSCDCLHAGEQCSSDSECCGGAYTAGACNQTDERGRAVCN